jgi:hypothetical protein
MTSLSANIWHSLSSMASANNVINRGPINNTKPRFNIVRIVSYHPDHVCAKPQVDGLDSQLICISHSYKINMVTVYLRARSANKDKSKMSLTIRNVMHVIDQIKPDIIITVDDIAFTTVGIPMANKGYRVYFTGLNEPFTDLIPKIHEPNLKYISGVQERIRLDNLLKLFDESNFTPDKYYIFQDNTATSKAMVTNYIEEITQKTASKYETITISSIDEFRNMLNHLQSKPIGVVILAFQAIKDELGYPINKQDPLIIDALHRHNSKHLELGGNNLFSKIGVSICIAPGFEDMGKLLANIICEDVKTGEVEHKVKTAYNTISLNTVRLQQLGFTNILDTAKRTRLVTTIYTDY